MKSFSFILLTFILLVANNSNASQTNDSIPVYETFKIESKQVGETRVINVWVPEEYTQNKDALSVMYMADGGIEEDFTHIAMTFSKLIQSKQIPPFILVGIENTQRRRDLTGPTTIKKDKAIAPVVGGSEKFRAFISEELIPEINKRYRTSDKKGILGESLSGLFVMETLLLQPELFDYYIAFDPSLWWNNHSLVKTAPQQLAKLPADKKVMWFAGSDAKDIFTYTKQFSKILESENPSTLKWTYSDEPNEQHSTIFKATKEKALIWTLNQLK